MPEFDDLAEWIDTWGLETAEQRLAKRMSSSLGELRAFHDAIVPRLEEIIEFLNLFPLDGIPAEHHRLALTALAVCEVDDAVNLWKTPVLDLASDPRTWRTKDSFFDYR
jgi:hypothetical protein